MSPDSVKPYHEGDYNVQQRDLLGVASFGLFLSTLAVGLRVVARRRLSVALWWDDYLAISALLLSYVPVITTIISVRSGLGRHVSEISADQIRVIGVTSFIVQTSYTLAFAVVNVTVLILYVRIFPLKTLHKVCYGIGSFSVVWCVVNEIVLFVQCIPVPKFWNPEIEGHCINQNILYSVAGFICLMNILVVYCVPLPVIMRLQINRSRKWAYAIAFTIGSFSCISGIVRLVLSLTLDHNDQTFSIAPSILWGCLEISTQVTSACIPSLMPLFLSWFGKGRGSKENQPYDQNAANHSPGKGRTDKKPRSNRLTDLLSLGDADRLPEAMDSSMISRAVPDETDNLGLVEAGKRSLSGIVVTDRIEQVNDSRAGDPKCANVQIEK